MGNLDGVKALLCDDKINVNVQDSNGDTPLHEACLHGEEEIVEVLLNKMSESTPREKIGSKIYVRNHLGFTPFHLACRNGNVNLARCLLSVADQPFILMVERDNEGATALHLACERDEPKIVEFLLEKEADPFAEKNDGMTPIHVAAQYGCQEVMRVFLSQDRVDININDKYSQTPLHFAAEYGKDEMMRLLLDE